MIFPTDALERYFVYNVGGFTWQRASGNIIVAHVRKFC